MLIQLLLVFQNNLHFHDVIRLTLDGLSSEGPDGTQLVTLGTKTFVISLNKF